MFAALLVIHVLAALGVIGLVLVQHGKGADMGAAFGSGSAGSLFGSAGAANFLSRTTAALAAVFFITSLGLTYMASNKFKGGSVVKEAPSVIDKAADKAKTDAVPAAPAAPAAAPATPSAAPKADDSKVKDIPK